MSHESGVCRPMMTRPGRGRKAIVTIALALSVRATAYAQGRTDIVTLANGDRITGEIVRLERGRLEFKTDDAGTLYLEWDKLSSLVAKRVVEVLTTDGRRFLGSLGPAAAFSIAVTTSGGEISLQMSVVTLITPIGASFWRQLDGSIDAGFNYTRSSGVAQLNVNSDTVYRTFASRARLTASLTLTKKDDESGRDDRAFAEMSYLRYPWARWFILTAGRFETNESVGLTLRSQVGAAAGPRLINSNRAQLVLGGGLALNDERGVDVEPTQNVEAFFTFGTSFYTYDRPKTNLDVSLQYYPSLSNAGRQRVQLDAGAKRELWKDFFVALNLFNTYDNRPPNPAAATNDVGIVLSIGWTY
jgi:Protein of unknown function, DUF481